MLQSCQQPIPHGHPAFCYVRVGAFCSHFFVVVVLLESEQNNTRGLVLFFFVVVAGIRAK